MPTAVYAPRTRQQPVPPVKVVRGGRYGLRRARRILRTALWLLFGVALVAMLVGVVYSQAQVTRLSGQIEKARTELTNAKSTYDYLSDEMGNITSSTNVQQIAEGRLGLTRADASQITYVKLQEESVVERSGSGLDRMLDGLGSAALSLIDQLDP